MKYCAEEAVKSMAKQALESRGNAKVQRDVVAESYSEKLTQSFKNKKIRGWHNKLGACGLCALGDGYFYLTKAGKSKSGRSATLYLARFVGNEKQAFEMVK